MSDQDDPRIYGRGDVAAAVDEAAWAQAAADVSAATASKADADTVTMLVARRALLPLSADAAGAAGAAARLAERHRDSATAFAVIAAGWMSGLDDARANLRDVRNRVLAVQMDDPATTAHVARALSLAQPLVPWHTMRLRPAVLAAALAVLGTALGSIARDATSLAPSPPAAADAVRACVERLPALAAELLSPAPHEERQALIDLLRTTGSAAHWGVELLENLEVDVTRAGAEGASREVVDRALATHRA